MHQYPQHPQMHQYPVSMPGPVPGPSQHPHQLQEQPQFALQGQQRLLHPALMTFSHTQDGRKYSLEVPQQPVRARMCGFGDKDRRPITPPPCVRLIVTDAASGKAISINEIEPMHFVLTVDLWNETGEEEVNLIKNQHDQSNKAQISLSQPSSFPPNLQHVYAYSDRGQHEPHMAVEGLPTSVGMFDQQPMRAGVYNPMMTAAQAGMYQAMSHMQPGPAYAPALPMSHPPPALTGSATPAANMYTRNLIGSLSVNATKLTDTENVEGIWFVLQDLSVRTEGRFRLKLSFMDIRMRDADNGRHSTPGDLSQLIKGRARILATQFSEPFDVFSAKKFPGVIESTPLSKAFATQGIKIPIRKDGPRDRDDQADYDADGV